MGRLRENSNYGWGLRPSFFTSDFRPSSVAEMSSPRGSLGSRFRLCERAESVPGAKTATSTLVWYLHAPEHFGESAPGLERFIKGPRSDIGLRPIPTSEK